MFDLSVIVPTYKRKEYLPALLESLAAQDYDRERWELVIVNDGSPDGTAEYLSSYRGPKPRNMTVVTQTNSGVATARNTGVKNARGRAVLFLDDDMTASPSLVGEHARAHMEQPRAVVVGHLAVPTGGRDPWVAWEDHQLAEHFEALRSGKRVPSARDFYSGNCSVETAVFNEVGGYDATLPRAEDVELGYRLQAAGAHFIYRAEADSLHLGRHNFEGWMRFARLYGEADLMLAWDKGHHELKSDIFWWFTLRQPAIRALVRVCDRYPLLEKPSIALLNLAGKLAYKGRQRNIFLAAYSAIYNLAYWRSIIETVGRRRFWASVKREAGKPRERKQRKSGDQVSMETAGADN